MPERRYPTSEVRGKSLECQAATAQEWPRGATLCLKSVVAGRRHPASEVGAAGESHLAQEVGGGDLWSHPEPEVRAGSQEEQCEEW